MLIAAEQDMLMRRGCSHRVLIEAWKEGLTRKYLEGVTSIEQRIRLFLLTIRKLCCAFFRSKDGKTNEADSKFLEIEGN